MAAARRVPHAGKCQTRIRDGHEPLVVTSWHTTAQNTERPMNGYVLIPTPMWWTGKVVDVPNDPRTYVPEHLVVYCEAHGLTEIPSGYVVHHRDEVPNNNIPSNLELLTRAKHMSLHQKGKKLGNKNALGNKSRLGQPHTEETKEKIRQKLMGNQNGKKEVK